MEYTEVTETHYLCGRCLEGREVGHLTTLPDQEALPCCNCRTITDTGVWYRPPNWLQRYPLRCAQKKGSSWN